MATKFNPNDHLINLKGKQYLPVQGRQIWFRTEHPQGAILTEPVSISPLLFKATILDADGRVLATGHAGAPETGGRAVWSGREAEKAETAAIGRALASAGYGTQFCGDEFDDTTHLSDSPRETKPAQPAPAPKGKGLTLAQTADLIEEAMTVFGVAQDVATGIVEAHNEALKRIPQPYNPDRAMATLLFGEASQRYLMADDDVMAILGHERISEYLADGGTFADAWAAIVALKGGK